MTQRTHYSLDTHNRLGILSSDTGIGVPAFLPVADGTFAVTYDNNLEYTASAPTGAGTPAKIKLKGTWTLDKNHDLIYTIDADETQQATGTLVFNGTIIASDGRTVRYVVYTKAASGKETAYTLVLTGTWNVGAGNQIHFTVKKEFGCSDTLCFSGKWIVSEHHELTYTYTRMCPAVGGTEASVTQQIALEGHWDMTGRTLLTYAIHGDTDSRCTFKVKVSRYDAGGRQVIFTLESAATWATRTIKIAGTWKVSDHVKLEFEVAYSGGRLRGMSFGAVCQLKSATACAVRLKATNHEDLGIEVELKRSVFDGAGEIFLRGLAARAKQELVAGVGFRW